MHFYIWLALLTQHDPHEDWSAISLIVLHLCHWVRESNDFGISIVLSISCIFTGMVLRSLPVNSFAPNKPRRWDTGILTSKFLPAFQKFCLLLISLINSSELSYAKAQEKAKITPRNNLTILQKKRIYFDVENMHFLIFLAIICKLFLLNQKLMGQLVFLLSKTVRKENRNYKVLKLLLENVIS